MLSKLTRFSNMIGFKLSTGILLKRFHQICLFPKGNLFILLLLLMQIWYMTLLLVVQLLEFCISWIRHLLIGFASVRTQLRLQPMVPSTMLLILALIKWLIYVKWSCYLGTDNMILVKQRVLSAARLSTRLWVPHCGYRILVLVSWCELI